MKCPECGTELIRGKGKWRKKLRCLNDTLDDSGYCKCSFIEAPRCKDGSLNMVKAKYEAKPYRLG